MRLSALAGLFACLAIFAANTSSASAQSLSTFNTNTLKQESFNIGILAAIKQEATVEQANEASSTTPEPKIHEVKYSETLSDIAILHETTWVRLFNKNEHIKHPDVLAVGDKITIPLADEVLTERSLPEPPQPEPVQQTSSVASARTSVPTQSYSRGSSSGNTYTPGYCTWYAKNMRPDLPNNLGNADTWVARAAAQGIPTGSMPRVGAIGQQGMHVVYVQSVNGDGTVTISEMNFQGLYVVSTRTVPAGYFQYIY
jgi:surface antigen